MTPRIHPAGRLLAALARLITGVQVRWAGSLPLGGQRVYFANHTSHLDFVLLWAALPAGLRSLTRPVAARDYWQHGLKSWFARNVFHAVLIDRAASPQAVTPSPRPNRNPARNPITHLTEALSTTHSLILFPEGTRGDGLSVAPFRSGLYHLARHRPDVELIPVYLDNMSRILPKGEILPIPLISTLTFGPPLHLGQGELKTEFLTRAHAALCALAPGLTGPTE